MHDFPVAVDATKQERLVASIVYFPALSFYPYLELDVRNRPGEIAFTVGFNIAHVHFKRTQGITLWLCMVVNPIAKTVTR